MEHGLRISFSSKVRFLLVNHSFEYYIWYESQKKRINLLLSTIKLKLNKFWCSLKNFQFIVLRIYNYATASSKSAAYIIGGIGEISKSNGDYYNYHGDITTIAEFKNNKWTQIGNLRIPPLYAFWRKCGRKWSFDHFIIHGTTIDHLRSLWRHI